MKNIGSTAKLNNGIEIPYLGLGVYQARAGQQAQNAVKWALETGYRQIDTAKFYANERDVGEAVRANAVPREEVFVTTKLWNSDHGYEQALQAFERSNKALGLDYVDLYLIHWPQGNRADSWRALLEIYESGKSRAIGVSNYTIRHLEELLSDSPVVPAVNQVEFHPFLYQKNLLEFCRAHGIQLQAYSPLTKGYRLNDANISHIAGHYGKSNAQIMIRWALQHDVVVIPKSSNQGRIQENADVFDFKISEADMAFLDALDENSHITWDPSDVR
jgi:diketogulonate reductase-like aldo/keto reductase